MAATTESLQRQVQSLCNTCSTLSPAIVPNGYETQDLCALIQHSGKDSAQAFLGLLEDAGRDVRACCVCGADGSPSTSNSGSEDEDSGPESTLFFTVFTQLDFQQRAVVFKLAGFACTQCRALHNTCRMLRFAALRVGGSAEQDDSPEDPGPQQRLLALAAHMAALNRAPDAVQASPEALVVWMQELYCRAYALQVVASNLGGWHAVGPDGQPLRLTHGKDVVAAAKLLLGQQSKRPQAGKPLKAGKKQKQGAKQQDQQAAEKATQGERRGKKKKGGEEVARGLPEEAPAVAEQQQNDDRRASKKQKKSTSVRAGVTAVANGTNGAAHRAAVDAPAAMPSGIPETTRAKTAAKPGGAGSVTAAERPPAQQQQQASKKQAAERKAAPVSGAGKAAAEAAPTAGGGKAAGQANSNAKRTAQEQTAGAAAGKSPSGDQAGKPSKKKGVNGSRVSDADGDAGANGGGPAAGVAACRPGKKAKK